jgi:hypothetical protein
MEARFKNWDIATTQGRDPFCILINADHVVAKIGKTSSRDQSLRYASSPPVITDKTDHLPPVECEIGGEVTHLRLRSLERPGQGDSERNAAARGVHAGPGGANQAQITQRWLATDRQQLAQPHAGEGIMRPSIPCSLNRITQSRGV